MSDPRKGHPEFAESEAPAPEKRMMGVRVPPLRLPKEEPEEEPKFMPVKVERGEDPKPSSSSNDPWVQRITAATALIVAVAGAGWGGAKLNERDVPSAKEAKELTAALRGCQHDVVSLKQHVEKIEARDDEQTKVLNLQSRQLVSHAQVIYLLNGRVAPIWRWPEARPDDWISGTDNLHRHVQRGGKYPGSQE